MSGILGGDNPYPDAKPEKSSGRWITIPGGLPWTGFRFKLKRPGRSRRLWLFPRVVLHWSRHGGTLEDAYAAIADEREVDLDTVKRQVFRERAFAREQEALDRARDQ